MVAELRNVLILDIMTLVFGIVFVVYSGGEKLQQQTPSPSSVWLGSLSWLVPQVCLIFWVFHSSCSHPVFWVRVVVSKHFARAETAAPPRIWGCLGKWMVTRLRWTGKWGVRGGVYTLARRGQCVVFDGVYGSVCQTDRVDNLIIILFTMRLDQRQRCFVVKPIKLNLSLHMCVWFTPRGAQDDAFTCCSLLVNATYLPSSKQ